MLDHRTIAAKNAGFTFIPGARVLDTLTGMEGKVRSSRFVHTLTAPPPPPPVAEPGPVLRLPTAMTLEMVTADLTDGSSVERPASVYIGLPAGVDLEAFR